MFKSIENINQSTLVPELKSKFTTAFTEFLKLGIKSGVYQGDLMFTSEDLRKEKSEKRSLSHFNLIRLSMQSQQYPHWLNGYARLR
jgi:hypothetical protein